MQYEIYLTILLMKHFSYKYILNISKNVRKNFKKSRNQITTKMWEIFYKNLPNSLNMFEIRCSLPSTRNPLQYLSKNVQDHTVGFPGLTNFKEN